VVEQVGDDREQHAGLASQRNVGDRGGQVRFARYD
jgi:hypothetical protein